MHMKMPVVLLVAESRQDLATALLMDDPLSNGLDDLQQARSQDRIQLQQGTNVLLRHHDHVLGAETGIRWPKGQNLVRLDHDIHLDQPGNHLIAIPIGLRHPNDSTITSPELGRDEPRSRGHYVTFH